MTLIMQSKSDAQKSIDSRYYDKVSNIDDNNEDDGYDDMNEME